jgi:hypothetical protein
MTWTLRDEIYSDDDADDGNADPLSEGGDISEDLSNQPEDPDD